MELNNCSLFDYDMDLFKVYNYPEKIRLGSLHDNGYVIGLIDVDYDCYISAGISTDDSFSVYFLNKYNIKKNDCYGFDGTIDNLPNNLHNHMNFINKNIGPFNNDYVDNLHCLINKYNNIFLKMDIEGSEWEWLKTLDKFALNKMSQIVIEFHGITNDSYHNNFNFMSFNTNIQEKIDCLKQLNETHYIIHAHGNNADKTSYNGIPNVIELTFINKKYFAVQPSLNCNPLPDPHLDYPNEKRVNDIDLNFYPFVNMENPFLISIQDKLEYDNNDYINIQQKLNKKNVDNIIEKLYTSKNEFYELNDFKRRINRGIKQKIINSENSQPIKTLYKIGNCDNNKNCIVCCTAFKNDDNDSRYTSSNNIVDSLKKSGYNGHFYLFHGGFPNPSGKEMKYAGVPYCFKIFLMLEAYNLGFKNVIWVDSGCYALNNPDFLFEILDKENVLLKKIMTNNNYDAMTFEKTMRLLNQLTKCDLHNAPYIETIVFGLNMQNDTIKHFIKEYYDMVDLGWPFFSIFPEEIVISALFNKPIYNDFFYNNQTHLYIHEKYLNEIDAKEKGYYFHHKHYNNCSSCIVTFADNNGRFGNQMFSYLMSKLITCKFGHIYTSIEQCDLSNFTLINDENVNDLLNGKLHTNKNILLNGFFQKSDYFVDYRKELIKMIYDERNTDYFLLNNQKCYIKDYLANANHSLQLNEDDVVISLRLDDFIQYPCKTTDIIPPQYYMNILKNMKLTSKLYIVCDKIKYDWEFKYIEYFQNWNPILLQNDLKHDIALMRDCNNLIHSNSTLCWIISFLSNKKQRIIPFTPKTFMNQNQKLEKIEINDILNYVNPLTHEEVFKLNVNSNENIFSFSFYIPDECVVNEIPEKTRLLASIIPGDMDTYIFKDKEKEYNDMYKKSRFAITKKKGGWDCLRHYEILMNGCIPIFENLKNCPDMTLTTYPKHLNDEAYELYNHWIENDEFIHKYNNLCSRFLEHTRKNCTISSQINYLMSNIKNSRNIKNILMITGHHGINYNREPLMIGLKRYTKEMNGIAVDYEKNMYIYDDTNNGNHFTYTKRVNSSEYINMSKDEIIEKINSNFWDLIIYGKVGPDEYCDFPFFDIIQTKYNKDQIVFIFGGDEIFNLKENKSGNYYINMHNVPIYYQCYIDYLNYYKHFGKCFVRELDM